MSSNGTSVILPPLPGLLLHPVFDVRPEVMSLGFSVRQEQGNKIVSKQLHIVSDAQRVKPFRASEEQFVAGKPLHYKRAAHCLIWTRSGRERISSRSWQTHAVRTAAIFTAT